MDFENYLDKVYGCWLGKCVCGNIGAPFEGMKQKLAVKFDKSMIEKVLPNDDLDLQVLFLDVVEEYGKDFSSAQLAEYFYKNCPYAPGEYAYFKKNYQCGILPPMSGRFNNEVYHNGMGCTIRSELWACLAPAQPELAVRYCLRDGIMDHYGDGLYGEVFITALESLAFAESDIETLIDKAKEYLPNESLLKNLIEDVVRWVKEGKKFEEVRDLIVSVYGSAEATSVYQNIGFILLGLLDGEGNYLESTIRVCNCGFDTDCTCATFGAIKGIIYGGKSLNREYDYSKVTYRLGVTAKKRSEYVYDLSREIAELGATLNNLSISHREYIEPKFKKAEDIHFKVEYADGNPGISFACKKDIVLHAVNEADAECIIKFMPSEPLIADVNEAKIPPYGKIDVPLTVWVDDKAALLPRKNLVKVIYDGDKEYCFGFSGAKEYEVYGPFWKNNVEVPELKGDESYWNYFPADGLSEQMDKIRFYHTNCFAKEMSLEQAIKSKNFLRKISVDTDIVPLENYLCFDGQAYYFLRYKFVFPQTVDCGLQAGFNVPFELFLNGKSIVKNFDCVRYTPENAHVFGLTIPQGENEIIVKIKKCDAVTRFSFDFLEDGACSNHIMEYSTKKIK